jgi:hypothetical protein
MNETANLKIVVDLSQVPEEDRRELQAFLASRGIDTRSFLEEQMDRLREARDRKRQAAGRADGRPRFAACDARCKGLAHSARCERERQVLALIVALREANPRMTLKQIASTLNERGIRPRSASLWTPSTVHGALKSGEQAYFESIGNTKIIEK